MDAFEKALNWVNKLLRLIGAMAVVGMMAVTCLDVVLRGFDHPVVWAVDMVGFLALMSLACALPITHAEAGHVGVDLFVGKLKPRTQAWFDATTSLVSSVLFGIVAWRMWLYAAELASKGEVSMTVQIPKSPFIYLVAVCFVMLAVTVFADFVRHMGKAVRG